jgi:hypothetical protein
MRVVAIEKHHIIPELNGVTGAGRRAPGRG